MTILEKVQAAEVGTVAVSIWPHWFPDDDEQICKDSTIVYVKHEDTWHCHGKYESTPDDVADLKEGERIYLIPPSALAQFEVTDNAS